MMKPALSWALSFLLIYATLCGDAVALQPSTSLATPAQAPRHVAIGGLLQKLGSGRDALVAVRLRDKSVVAGYVNSLGTDSLSIVDRNSGAVHAIDYAHVDRLAGYNLETGAQVEHGGGIRAKLARAASYVLPIKHLPANRLAGTTEILLIGIIVGVLIAIVVAKTV